MSAAPGLTTEPPELHLQVYTAFRNDVQHEDNLTNNRLNWNFTIQGFLFFSWAYCLQKIDDLKIAINNSNRPLDPGAKEALLTALKDSPRYHVYR